MIIIPSALTFSLPFLFVENLAWLIFFFPVSLFLIFQKNLTKPLACGFLWGLIAYGLHFIWLLDLLIKKSNATVLFSIFLYFVVVAYTASTSAIWFWVTSLVAKRTSPLAFLLTTPIYFFLLDRYMFWFFQSGYPFLNPLIPLMRYKSVACFLSFFLAGFGWKGGEINFMPQQKQIALQTEKGVGCLFIYLYPSQNKNMHEAATEIKRQIKSLNLKKQAKSYDCICVVGPESTFPFYLNQHKEYVSWWMSGLPENVSLTLGAYSQEKQKNYQSVYNLKAGLIKIRYDKSHRIVFAEKFPRWLKKNKWAGGLFLKNKQSIKKGKNISEEQLFQLAPNLSLTTLICSELFFISTGELLKRAKDRDFCVAFVNDSWFVPYFRKIMMLSARLKTLFLGKRILYVGHFSLDSSC
ncbi:hypothetical protein KAT92_03845 [Candidatus Babeliales bacterium]|nr:hypothetical protein [Candidatus Babeliales bacterium]